MHRLLSAAGCQAAVVGNAAWLRYGPHVIPDQARAAAYPLLLANLEPVEGVRPTTLVDGVGFVGVTDPFRSFLGGEVDYGIRATDEAEAVLRGARELRAQGAELVVCLSHLGYRRFADDLEVATVDPELAERVQGRSTQLSAPIRTTCSRTASGSARSWSRRPAASPSTSAGSTSKAARSAPR